MEWSPQMWHTWVNMSTLLFLRSQRFCCMFQHVDLSGARNFSHAHFDAPISVGFRPLWQDWQSNQSTLWNRYYLDYFVHFHRPVQLNFRSLSKTLMNHTCLHHGFNTLHLVQYFKLLRNDLVLSMLMHMPMTRDQHRAVETWNFPEDTQWYIVIEAACSRL